MSQRKAPPFVEVARILDGYFFTKGHAPPVRELRGLCGGEGSLETYSDYTKRWLAQKMLGAGAMASILAIQEQAKAHAQIIDGLLAQLQRALSMPVIEHDDAVDLASGEEQLVSETDEHRGVQYYDSEPATPQTSAGSSSETANVVTDTSAHASSPEPNANGKPVRCSNGQETPPPNNEEASVAVASAVQAPRQPTCGQRCSPNEFASSPAEPDRGIDMERYTLRDDDDDEDPVLRHRRIDGTTSKNSQATGPDCRQEGRHVDQSSSTVPGQAPTDEDQDASATVAAATVSRTRSDDEIDAIARAFAEHAQARFLPAEHEQEDLGQEAPYDKQANSRSASVPTREHARNDTDTSLSRFNGGAQWGALSFEPNQPETGESDTTGGSANGTA